MSASGDPAERLRRFEAVTDTTLARLDLDQLLDELLERLQEALSVDTVAALYYDSRSASLIPIASVGGNESLRRRVRLSPRSGVAGRVFDEQRAVVVEQGSGDAVSRPMEWEKDMAVILGTPMLANGQLVGALLAGCRTPRTLAEHDVQLVQMVADRVGLAVQAQATNAELAAASTLQASLVPDTIPSVPGLRFAARYVAGAGIAVGGDWYDVFALPGGKVGIVMGDVAGHGLPASVVMGRLRSALRAYALDNGDPAVVLEKLDRKAIHFETGTMTTVLYAVADAAEGTLWMSSAGHLPPVLAALGRPPVFADILVDPPIGMVALDRPRQSMHMDVPVGSVCCFYTDGLIERRDRALDDGLEQLRTSVVPDLPEAVCDTLMSLFVDEEPVDDDVAVLVLRRENSY
ncbi:MAG TPA: GAF domain-containing SpoIIE family protein phosphatase [Amycolatopsis sp.]|nr:GAF domain-containing SpoIIE family protein phosphatase [Amycolatopsis sp.]